MVGIQVCIDSLNIDFKMYDEDSDHVSAFDGRLSYTFLDQGEINNHLQAIFGIETGFQGTLISQFAKVGFTDSYIIHFIHSHSIPMG
jgi:hypothetical protein